MIQARYQQQHNNSGDVNSTTLLPMTTNANNKEEECSESTTASTSSSDGVLYSPISVADAVVTVDGAVADTANTTSSTTVLSKSVGDDKGEILATIDLN